MTDHPDNPLFETVKRLQHETDQKGERIQYLQGVLTKRNATIEIQNEQHMIDIGKIDRLVAQVKEFRQKCDPKEEHVLVTAEEMIQSGRIDA